MDFWFLQKNFQFHPSPVYLKCWRCKCSIMLLACNINSRVFLLGFPFAKKEPWRRPEKRGTGGVLRQWCVKRSPAFALVGTMGLIHLIPHSKHVYWDVIFCEAMQWGMVGNWFERMCRRGRLGGNRCFTIKIVYKHISGSLSCRCLSLSSIYVHPADLNVTHPNSGTEKVHNPKNMSFYLQQKNNMQHFIANSFNFLPKASPRSVKQYWKRASVWIVQCRGQEKSLKLVHLCFFAFGRSFWCFICFVFMLFLGFYQMEEQIIVFVLRDHGRNGSKHSYSRMVAEDRV